ncbi:hypothetical protein [Arthrobacter sp. H14]|uniref:hypothetical protein n=1 Tax=Arthrobacter sp. H14 TaxID=1312959 RepID=UPI00047CB8B1|nr:hypothetical protein [Arthrobacter sp. H14]
MTVYAVRQPKGTRTGGQFAAQAHAETGLRLARPLTREQALNLTTLKPGKERNIGADVHGIAGVETINLKNLGRGTGLSSDRNVIEMRFALTAESNIAELYESENRGRAESQGAAVHAALERVGMEAPKGWSSIPGMPEDRLDLDDDGNLTFVQYDSFGDGEKIDPEDLASWTEGYDAFASPSERHRLEEAITERYNED